ncbi:WG repeat-containing protein [Psychrobacter sp. FDAARGOS_221]|uniref:WG repeat-containing protein n=1 Tax=Psychrobacter sp. FDAARGOS_221 TaxID=1975705 RepID=UPI000FDA03E4|nr:WG repeat-containing protein [Psychrobacter sp. FDAARGOS_221]
MSLILCSKYLSTGIKSLIIFAVLMSSATITYAEINSCYYRGVGVNYSDNNNKFIVPAGTVLDMNEVLKDIRLEKKGDFFTVKDAQGRPLYQRLYDIEVYTNGYIIAKQANSDTPQGDDRKAIGIKANNKGDTSSNYGLINPTGKLIYDFKYQGIDLVDDELVILTTQYQGHQSDTLMTHDGQVIYPAKSHAGITNGADKQNTAVRITAIHYDTESQQGYFQVDQNDKSGVINQHGDMVVPLIYDEMSVMNDTCESVYDIDETNALKVRIDNKLGLIQPNGQWSVPLAPMQSIIYFNTQTFTPFILNHIEASQGEVDSVYWRPQEKDTIRENLITLKGEVLLTSDEPIKDLRGNFYQFSKNGKVGIINNWAEIILDANYDRIIVKPNQKFLVERAGKLGLAEVDQSGNALIVRRYFDTLQPAQSVDTDDIRVTEDIITWNEETSEFEAETGLDQYIPFPDETYNKIGEDDKQYFSSNSITNEYYGEDTLNIYIASSNKQYGVFNIDTVLIPFIYDSIIDVNGVFIVEDSGKYGVLGVNNNVIKPIIYNSVQDAKNALSEVR